MLLRTVKAANFRDFRVIEIPDIPPAGMLVVEGDGVAEPVVLRDLISYAFFGQTADGASAPDAIISPGRGYSWVEVVFFHPATGESL